MNFKSQNLRTWIKYALQVILILIPPVMIMVLVRHYYVDVPFWDQWTLVYDLDRLFSGRFSFEFCFRFHNEHRLFFPRLIMLGMARFTHWDIGWELTANLIAGLMIFFAYLYYIKHIYRFLKSSFSIWLVCLGSWLAFSINQASNWFWGWQIQIFLAVLCVFVCIIWLSLKPLNWKYFIAACVASVIASYSFGNSLIIWPLGFLLILSQYKKTDSRVVLFSILWIFIAAIVIMIYYHDGFGNGRHVAYDYIRKYPVVYVKYVLAFIGSPVHRARAVFFGANGSVIFCALSALYLKFSKFNYRAIILPMSLCVFVIISGIIIALGRVDMGWQQGASSRYVTISNLFWYGLTGLGILCWNQLEMKPEFPKIRKWIVAGSGIALSILIISDLHNEASLETCIEHKLYIPQIKERQQFLQEGRNALLHTGDEEALLKLYPDLVVLRECDAILKEKHLGIYRKINSSE